MKVNEKCSFACLLNKLKTKSKILEENEPNEPIKNKKQTKTKTNSLIIYRGKTNKEFAGSLTLLTLNTGVNEL